MLKKYVKKFITSIFFLADYRLLEIFIIGLIGATPIAFLTLSIIVWLKESEIDLSLITLFTFARLPTSLRFIWAPFIDSYSPTFFLKLGHRKRWFVLCCLVMSILIFISSTISPQNSLKLLFILCIIIAFTSATYDINFDAYRIELFEPKKQSLGAAAAVLGYRSGVIIMNFGVLSVVSYTNSWAVTIKLIAMFFIGAVFLILIFSRNVNSEHKYQKVNLGSIKKIMHEPFQDFFKKRNAILILSAVILFKAGESLATIVALPYYLDIGFSKTQISEAIKICGLSFAILGIFLGVIAVYIFGSTKGLIFSGIIQLSMIIALLCLKNHSTEWFALCIAIAIENMCEGMSSVALMNYLSTICNKKYLASQYALLVAASGIFGNTICAYSGKLVEILNWSGFFIFALIASLPSLIILAYLNANIKNKTEF